MFLFNIEYTYPQGKQLLFFIALLTLQLVNKNYVKNTGVTGYLVLLY